MGHPSSTVLFNYILKDIECNYGNENNRFVFISLRLCERTLLITNNEEIKSVGLEDHTIINIFFNEQNYGRDGIYFTKLRDTFAFT